MLDLWLQPVDETSVKWAETHSSVLDEEETQRWRRYRTDESSALFLVAHVVTRLVLSRYDDRDPAMWQFDRGANGRPEIVGGPFGLRFNISHTEGMVAVLVHGQADCGVDVEHTWRATDIRGVSRRVFTDAEQDSIFSLPSAQQADRFYQLWTLKEAFIKAKGKGFALPLSKFSFTIATSKSGAEPLIGFACDPALDSEPNDWQFFTHRPESGHVVSIAAHRRTELDDSSFTVRRLDTGVV